MENNTVCEGSVEKRCCAGYLEVNGTCEECPAGRFGLNCSSPCKTNFYGRLCLAKCMCSIDQYCDNVKGCLRNSSSDLSISRQNVSDVPFDVGNIQEDLAWRNTAFILAWVLLILIAMVGALQIKSRFVSGFNGKTKARHRTGNENASIVYETDQTSRVSASLSSRSCIGENQLYEEPDSTYPYDNLSLRDQGVALFFQSNVMPNSPDVYLVEMKADFTGTLMSDQVYSLASMPIHKRDVCTDDIAS